MDNSSFEKSMQQATDTIVKKADDISELVQIENLITPEFMQSHSKFKNVGELFSSAGFELNSQTDLSTIPYDEFNAFISQHTDFNSWEELYTEAGNQYLIKNFKF